MWASVVSLPSDGCPPFPVSVQNPHTMENITLESEFDVYTLFNSWHGVPDGSRFEFMRILGFGMILIDPELQKVISRKFYCDRYSSVPPFHGDYDAQPDWWITAVNIINRAENDARTFLEKRNAK